MGSKKNKKESDLPTVFANRYHVLKKLGSGNYGTAFLAKDSQPHTEEELKVLKEINVGYIDPEETIDAVHEANLLRKLDNPFVVKFFDSFLDGKSFCIVTEYCEGGDLDQVITKTKKEGRRFEEEKILRWIVQLFLGVHYIHSRRILHRDLKSRNIFLKRNKVKIGDFGISRVLYDTTDLASSFIGTPYYMSPEVLKHAGYNSKSDVWSVGCILYELCALKHAFDGQGLMGVMYKIVEEECPRLPNEYSHELQNLLQKILTKEPTERPSAKDVLQSKVLQRYLDTINEEDAVAVSMTLGKKEASELKLSLSKSTHAKDLSGEYNTNQEEEFLSPVERMKRKRQQEADKRAKELSEAAKDSVELHKLARQRKEKTNLSSEMLPFNRVSPRPTYADDYHYYAEDTERSGSTTNRTLTSSSGYGSASSPRPSVEAPWRTSIYTAYGDHQGEALEATRTQHEMRNTAIYDAHRGPMDVNHSSDSTLVKRSPAQAIDDAHLAEQYYEDDFEQISEEEYRSDQEATTISTVQHTTKLASHKEEEVSLTAGRNTVKDDMLRALYSSDVGTVYDESSASLFDERSKQMKIENMKRKCQLAMGEKFTQLHKQVKSLSKKGLSSPSIQAQLIGEGVSANHVFLLEQLVFLEEN